MRTFTRACVVSIVARLAGNKVGSHVYDQTSERFFRVDGKVTATDVNVVLGRGGFRIVGTLPMLMAGNEQLQLSLKGHDFSGYDWHNGQHFRGSVGPESVHLWDASLGKWFEYFISPTTDHVDPDALDDSVLEAEMEAEV